MILYITKKYFYLNFYYFFSKLLTLDMGFRIYLH